jgi:hypothetical protein
MNKDDVKAFTEKVYGDMAGAMAVGMAYVGVKTGLFHAMEGKGQMHADEVVQASGLHPRYVEEWLKGMAAAGYLLYEPAAETFHLPEERAYLVASEGTDHFMGGLFYLAPVFLGVAPKVADAFRMGGGIRFEDFGPECVVALDMISSGQYEQRLTNYWLSKLCLMSLHDYKEAVACLMSAAALAALPSHLQRPFPNARSLVLIPILSLLKKPAKVPPTQALEIVFAFWRTPRAILTGATVSI